MDWKENIVYHLCIYKMLFKRDLLELNKSERELMAHTWE